MRKRDARRRAESGGGSEKRGRKRPGGENVRASGRRRKGWMNVAEGAKKKKINLRRKRRSCNEASKLNPLRPSVSLRYWL